MASSVFVQIPDLRHLLLDLDAIDRDLGREVRQAIVDASEPILETARKGAPYDPAHRGHKGNEADPGHIRDSLHVRKAPYGAALYATHPGAPVHHWGGTIAPRGTPISIEGDEFATKAGQLHAGRVSERVERSIDSLLRSHNL